MKPSEATAGSIALYAMKPITRLLTGLSMPGIPTSVSPK